MPREKQRLLANSVQEIVSNIKAEDVATIMAMAAGDAVLRKALLGKIVQTVEQQANVKVSNFEL